MEKDGIKSSERRRSRTRTTLFIRIMIRLCIPLFFLGAGFMAIQLTNQISTLNRIHQLESRLALDALTKVLDDSASGGEFLHDPQKLVQKLEKIETLYHLEPVQIFEVLEKEPLLKNRPKDWSALDKQRAEESLYMRDKGKPYHVLVDREAKKFFAYIPMKGLSKKRLFVARAVSSLADVKSALASSRMSLGLILFAIVLVGFMIVQGLAKSIVEPIKKLNSLTEEIMRGKLGKHAHIRTGDEIESLANTFNAMSDTIKKMKEDAIDANPLSGLPGNQGITRELIRRISERQKFVMFHTDLDRFKVFNDHYGLAHGDQAIKKTADLLAKVVKEKGGSDDYVGHQGGDDFVVITRPTRAPELGEAICKRFEAEVVPALYPKEDLQNGYTLHMDRRRFTETGEEVMTKFPLLALSLAGVSSAKNDFADYFECLAKAVEVKKEVKKDEKSSYMIVE